MKQKNLRLIRKNQLRHYIEQELKYYKKLDRIASGGGTSTDFPIGSHIPCPVCFKLFQKECDPGRDTTGGTDQIAVKIQHKDRLLTDPGAIEDVLAVENDVVPFDRLTCRSSLAGRSNTQQSPSGADLATLEDSPPGLFWSGPRRTGFETEGSWPGVDKNPRLARRYLTTQRSGYHSR